MSQHKPLVSIFEDDLSFLEDPAPIKKPEPPKESELTRMIYKNPKSKDHAIQQGVQVLVKLKQISRLMAQNDGEEYPTAQDVAWCINWKGSGAWLCTKYLSREPEVNEFGVVSP